MYPPWIKNLSLRLYISNSLSLTPAPHSLGPRLLRASPCVHCTWAVANNQQGQDLSSILTDSQACAFLSSSLPPPQQPGEPKSAFPESTSGSGEMCLPVGRCAQIRARLRSFSPTDFSRHRDMGCGLDLGELGPGEVLLESDQKTDSICPFLSV